MTKHLTWPNPSWDQAQYAIENEEHTEAIYTVKTCSYDAEKSKVTIKHQHRHVKYVSNLCKEDSAREAREAYFPVAIDPSTTSNFFMQELRENLS